MKKLAWLTDIHLDFLDLEGIEDFAYKALRSDPDAFLIGGDISIAPLLHTHLRILEHYWQRPIYFVLGNHDYYKASINKIRAELPDFVREYPHLKWLPQEGIVELSPTTALIGHGLWADGRLGAAEKSKILLNDYALIEELTHKGHRELFFLLNALGDRAVLEFEPTLRAAIKKYSHIYALTHTSPFAESAWHNHHISDPQFLPHFSCHAAGEMIRSVMSQHPDKMLTVLCGHTHGEGQVWITDNIFVKTGGAQYRFPRVQEILKID
ncbi:phosphoesterase [candidate division KSB1 bacterium]|nr:metallophosphoesterase [candidate division KSB1 bacterium]RQW03117.1 MAG: phosphoesterase [candidate division KSB1 bacterium]